MIAQERARRGNAFPWTDMMAFATRALEVARYDHDWAMRVSGLVFFDRGIIDAAAALEHACGRPLALSVSGSRYNARIFMTPPWPEIYETDADRQHSLEAAIAEYERLLAAYGNLGYEIEVLPKIGVAARADLVLARLKADTARGNAAARKAVTPKTGRQL